MLLYPCLLHKVNFDDELKLNQNIVLARKAI